METTQLTHKPLRSHDSSIQKCNFPSDVPSLSKPQLIHAVYIYIYVVFSLYMIQHLGLYVSWHRAVLTNCKQNRPIQLFKSHIGLNSSPHGNAPNLGKPSNTKPCILCSACRAGKRGCATKSSSEELRSKIDPVLIPSLLRMNFRMHGSQPSGLKVNLPC